MRLVGGANVPAITGTVGPSIRWATGGLAGGAGGEDLVDAHAALFEGQGAAGQVEPPDADLLGGQPAGDLGAVGGEVDLPGADGADVVLPQGLGALNLETGPFEQVDGLAQGTHVHVGGDVRLDERAAARRPAGPGHLLDEDPAAGADVVVQGRAEPGVLLGADVFAHLHRGNGVVTGPGDVAVVADLDVDQGLQTQVPDPAGDEGALLGRQRDRGDPDLVLLGGVEAERTPAAADVEQPGAGGQVKLGADQLQLVALGVGQGVARIGRGPVARRVGHPRIENELVELGRQVVVPGDHGPVAGLAVAPAGHLELAGRGGQREADGPQPGRRAESSPGGGREAHRPPAWDVWGVCD